MRVRFSVPALLGLWLLISGAGCHSVREPAWTARQPPIQLLSEVTDQQDKDLLRILLFGDSGSGTEIQLRVGLAMAEACERHGGCDLALVAGDLLYDASNGEAAFDERFEVAYEPLGRLDFWMVYIGRDNGAASGDFITYKFSCNFVG